MSSPSFEPPSLLAARARVADIEARVASLRAGTAEPVAPAVASSAPTGASFAQALAWAGGTTTVPLGTWSPGGATAAPAYPLGTEGKLIGRPYEGTHTLYGNWESDNAVDLAVPTGTPVYAVADGTIGSQIGALRSGDPHLQGLRLHLVTAGNEYYYAHLSQLVVAPGQQVARGQLIGYSGSANGVEHLHFAERAGNPLDLVSGAAATGPV